MISSFQGLVVLGALGCPLAELIISNREKARKHFSPPGVWVGLGMLTAAQKLVLYQKTAMPWVNVGLSRTPKYFDFLAHHHQPLSQLAAHIPRHGLGARSLAGPASLTPEGYAALSYGMHFLDPEVAKLTAGPTPALRRLMAVLGRVQHVEQAPEHHVRQALHLYPEAGLKRVFNVGSRDHVSIMGTPAMTPEKLLQIEEASKALLPEMPEVARESARKLNLLYSNVPAKAPMLPAKPRGFKPRGF
jgi:hypothetical protein